MVWFLFAAFRFALRRFDFGPLYIGGALGLLDKMPRHFRASSQQITRRKVPGNHVATRRSKFDFDLHVLGVKKAPVGAWLMNWNA
jgi:hypothetical protein